MVARRAAPRRLSVWLLLVALCGLVLATVLHTFASGSQVFERARAWALVKLRAIPRPEPVAVERMAQITSYQAQ